MTIEGVGHRIFAATPRGGIAQRIHAVALRFFLEALLQGFQLVRELRCQVVALRVILGDVIELPAFLLAVELEARETNPGQAAVEAGGDPTVLVEGPVAQHLEVLGTVRTGRGAIIEAVRHACAMNLVLGDAIDSLRRGYARQLQNGRENIDHVVELRAQFAAAPDAVGPGEGKRIASAAEVRRYLFHPLER